MAPSATNAKPVSARKRGGKIWPPLVLLGSAAAALGVFLAIGPASEESPFDEDFCRVAGDAPEPAAFLVDVSKPIDADLADLPGRLLEHVTLGLEAHAELRVYTIESDPAEPLWFVGRLCKPYRNADLQVATAKDQTARRRDCDDLPGQLPPATRDLAVRFCERRTALGERLNSIQTPDAGTPVSDAPLVDALEASLRGAAGRPAPAALYVFSDMLHHAEWFSHLDAGAKGWGFESYRTAAEARTAADLPSAGPPVTVFYLPRVGLTDEPGAELLHKRFWRAYFGGSEVTFRDQPPGLGYTVVPRYEAVDETPPDPDPAPSEPVPPEVDLDRMAEMAARQVALDAEARRLAEEEVEQDRRYRDRLAELEARERALDEREAASERQVADAPARERGPESAPSASAALALGPSSPSVASPPGSADETPAVAGREEELNAEPDTAATVAGGSEPLAGSDDTPPVPPVAFVPPPADEEPDRVALASGAVRDEAPIPACRLAHASTNAMPPYPSDRNRGTATVVLSFLVDERGETLDDSIAVVESRSSAETPRYYQRFRTAAVRTARSWEFVSATDTDCELPQLVTQPIQFHYQP